jgi:hypothetical protein
MRGKFVIIEYRRWWLENNTTRNAFYQVFDIVAYNAAGDKVGHVLATHYGAHKFSDGQFSRPIKGGAVKTKALSLSSGFYAADEAIEKKVKGNYLIMASDSRHIQADPKWIVEQFGADKGWELEQKLLGNDANRAERTEALPITPTHNSLIELPEHAGSW